MAGAESPVTAIVFRVLTTLLLVASLTLTGLLFDKFCWTATSAGQEFGPSLNHKPQIECEVLIIGSGFAGSYAAYQLAPQYKEKLCLVERNDRDGGRIYDITEYPDTHPDGPVFGLGALRITNWQTTLIDLAETHLNITLQEEEFDVEMSKVRGRYFYGGKDHGESERMCQEMFPTLNCTSADHDMVKTIFDRILALRDTFPFPNLIDQHPDFPTLILSLFGDEGLAFLRSAVRYNSLLTSISTHGVIDFLLNELSGAPLNPVRYYPVGGMSAYIVKMLRIATNHGLRIHRGQPVLSISTSSNGFYTVETKSFTIRATKILCSIDPLGFADVIGNVADVVKNAPEFRAIAPKSLSIVQAWWNERWWENSAFFEKNLSRIVSHENCFNVMDIPPFKYGRDQNVTRAVYDDGACVNTWRTLVPVGNEEKLAREVVSSLQHFFGDTVVVPQPRTIRGVVFENAWHFQHPGSTVTNAAILKWSRHPLPYDNFALIGEAYNLAFAAWCDGASKSVMHVLTEQYGFDFPCLDDVGSPADCSSSTVPKMKDRKFNVHYALP